MNDFGGIVCPCHDTAPGRHPNWINIPRSISTNARNWRYAFWLAYLEPPASTISIMQDIEPFYGWEKYYTASEDERSPFHEREYNMQQYENDIYGYYIHPLWDEIGSETLYCKILFANYERHFVVIELFGEWNDTLHNDIMYLKRQVIDPLVYQGIKYFILVSENILNFHGSDDSYYEEWFEDIEDGWIAAIHSPEFIEREWKKYHLDYYINFGGTLDIANWRTLKPASLFELVNTLIIRRLG